MKRPSITSGQLHTKTTPEKSTPVPKKTPSASDVHSPPVQRKLSGEEGAMPAGGTGSIRRGSTSTGELPRKMSDRRGSGSGKPSSDGFAGLEKAFAKGGVPAAQIMTLIMGPNVCGIDSKDPRSGDCSLGKGRKDATPLHYAALYGHLEVVQQLLSKGVSVNEKTEFGSTPLHMAVYNASLPITRLLLEHGCLMDIEDVNGNTPVRAAIVNGRTAIFKLFLDKGAPMDAKSTKHSGYTLMHTAAANGKLDIVKILVERGASFNEKTDKGSTPMECAKTSYHKDVVEYLKSKGCTA